MNDPLYRIHALRKRLSANFTLGIDDLVIYASEVIALVGPTGSGKTTLLRLLTGLVRPDHGEIQFQGVTLGDQLDDPVLRQIAMVHQKPLLLARSVRANVEYGLRARNLPVDSKVDFMLARLKLARLADQDARTLSGGQTQLVGLARSLVVEPSVLLLDEPTANLDPAHVALVEQVIVETGAERSLAIVWATHNLFQARRVAQRVALLLDGQCIEVASTENFFGKPEDARTAAFVQGKMVY